jgi:hypothetical protein
MFLMKLMIIYIIIDSVGRVVEERTRCEEKRKSFKIDRKQEKAFWGLGSQASTLFVTIFNCI